MSDGMFLSACRQVANDFPEVTYDEDLLDRVCLQVRFLPESFRPVFFWAKRLRPKVDHAKPCALRRPGHGHAQLVR